MNRLGNCTFFSNKHKQHYPPQGITAPGGDFGVRANTRAAHTTAPSYSCQQASDYRQQLLSLATLQRWQHTLLFVVVAYPHPKSSLSSVCQEEGKGRQPLRTQGSPLRSDLFLRFAAEWT